MRPRPLLPTIQPTRGYVAAQAESDWPVEEGDRRPQWKLNGKTLSTSDSYSRNNCSFSRQRCWCTLEHNEQEKRSRHMAYMFKPDPPSAVAVRVVEGQEKMLRVTWAFPCSWKLQDQYYELIYEISYKPATSPGHHSLQSDSTKSQRYTITDVLPKVEYVIKLRAKDEYDGLWSDWSTPELFNPGEGSGIEEPSTSVQIQDQVWHHVLWISGLCVLISLALAVYTFRHREKFVLKLHNCNLVIAACAAGPHPQAHTTPSSTTTTPSTPHPQEGHALVTFTPARCKDTLPNAVEEEKEEEEEEREPERKPDTRSEAISFNNTSYFLLQRETESPPQHSGPKCL
ncbi:hypothetical protein CRUP_034889 [Coryphaenoides rupestris]|nr:hypothetical protein CRUP_034889 [Coryphaenoides rupestris]